MREGRVDVEGFLGDATLLVLPLKLQGAHVVKAIRTLHDDDADILPEGQHQLTKVLRLFFKLALVGQLA